MKPPIYKFKDLSSFIGFIKKFPNNEWIFRGQAKYWKNNQLNKIEYPLCPKAGRREYFVKPNENFDLSDLGRFRRWYHQAVAFSEQLPKNEFECLALAQHYGLATRFLDWTANPLVALFFAIEKSLKDDGAVFFYRPARTFNSEKKKLKNCSSVVRYNPRPIDQRILAQDGIFTLHPKPENPLEAKSALPPSEIGVDTYS